MRVTNVNMDKFEGLKRNNVLELDSCSPLIVRSLPASSDFYNSFTTYVGSSEMAVSSSSSMACLNQGGFASTGSFSGKRPNDKSLLNVSVFLIDDAIYNILNNSFV